MADYDISGVSLPYSLEAEQSVLGAVLLDGDSIAEIANSLQPENFYVSLNKEIYTVMLRMFLSGEKIDIVTVLNEISGHNIFETPEQAKEYLAGLMTSVPSISAIAKYAKIISEKYLIRSLILAAKEIIDTAGTGSEDADTLIDFAEQKIFDIRSGSEVKGLTHISGIVLDRINVLNELYKNAGESGGELAMTGLSTHFKELDKKIFGLNHSDLIILAARPGMGKTTFAMNIAANVGKRYTDKSIAVFSLEMSKEQIVSRMINSEASLTSEQMRTGRFPAEKWRDIGQAADVLSRLNIYIDDTPGMNVAGIKSKLRRMKGLGLVIIDYLQLMSASKNYNGNRVVEISDITRNLKIMAKELDVPVITLSQLARGPEQRPDKRPLLSDLRESGSIEQDADIVMFLYRNSYYDKTDPNVNACECIVAKNRHGETATVPIGWEGEYTRFTNAEIIRT